MKIKPIINEEKTIDLVRYNPNTKGTHLFILDGEDNNKKRDYANIVLTSLMFERGFLKESLEDTINKSKELIADYEQEDIMGL
jgi:hypothetical protein